jgi:hypothetical protein
LIADGLPELAGTSTADDPDATSAEGADDVEDLDELDLAELNQDPISFLMREAIGQDAEPLASFHHAQGLVLAHGSSRRINAEQAHRLQQLMRQWALENAWQRGTRGSARTGQPLPPDSALPGGWVERDGSATSFGPIGINTSNDRAAAQPK